MVLGFLLLLLLVEGEEVSARLFERACLVCGFGMEGSRTGTVWWVFGFRGLVFVLFRHYVDLEVARYGAGWVFILKYSIRRVEMLGGGYAFHAQFRYGYVDSYSSGLRQ